MRGFPLALARATTIAWCAAAARAQPQVIADLGTLTPPVTLTRVITLTPGQVQWVRFQVPLVQTPTTWLDIHTRLPPPPASPLSNADPILGLYGPSGLRLATDDDDGSLRQAALSFGITSPTRPAPTGALPFNGRDGALAPGVHYLSVSAVRTDFAPSAWNVSSLSQASGSVELVIDLGCSACPAPPTASSSAVPSRAFCPQEVLVRVFTSPGANPALPVSTVTLDLSAWGGPVDFVLGDDGVGGDFATGDGIFSRLIPVPTQAPPGPTSLPFTATDELGREARGSVTLSVAPLTEWNELFHGSGDAGDSIALAQRPGSLPPVPLPGLGLSAVSGSLPPSDADLYVIRIDDPAAFSASAQGTTGDTQLFLFSLCDGPGRGVTFNDNAEGVPNVNFARLTARHVASPGLYVLGVAGSDRDPVGPSGAMWLDLPLNIERRPDGPGAGEPLVGWMGSAGTINTYLIELSGCSRPAPGNSSSDCQGACRADIDGSGSLDPDDLATYIACFFEAGGLGCPLADFDGSGQIDADDLADYIAAYFDPASPCSR